MSQSNSDRLVLPRAAWQALLDGSGPDQEAVRRSLPAGSTLATGERLTDTLALMLETAAAAVCELTVRVDGSTVDGWVGSELMVLVTPVDHDWIEFDVVPTTWLPVLLIDLVGLGPRRGNPPLDPVVLGAADFQSVIDGRAVGGVNLDDSLPSHWEIQVRWGSSSSRAIEILDTGECLWELKASGEERRHLCARTSTWVFARLVELLPTDSEIQLVD